MAESVPGLEALRARMQAAEGEDPAAMARAAREHLAAVLELVATGRGVREAGSGLNAASSELLLADALLTEAAARAASTGDGIEEVLRVLELVVLAERARAVDEAAA